jgi:hypothetical protein
VTGARGTRPGSGEPLGVRRSRRRALLVQGPTHRAGHRALPSVVNTGTARSTVRPGPRDERRPRPLCPACSVLATRAGSSRWRAAPVSDPEAVCPAAGDRGEELQQCDGAILCYLRVIEQVFEWLRAAHPTRPRPRQPRVRGHLGTAHRGARPGRRGRPVPARVRRPGAPRLRLVGHDLPANGRTVTSGRDRRWERPGPPWPSARRGHEVRHGTRRRPRRSVPRSCSSG